jgi:hypothetical protein
MNYLPLLLLLVVLALPQGDDTRIVDAGSLLISQRAVDNVMTHETGGYDYYRKFCERPENPGFSSGVTIGVGYDLKFHTPAQIRKDWAGVVTPEEMDALCSVAGKPGSVVGAIKYKVRITWEEAQTVFKRTTVPEWSRNTAVAYRISNPIQLHPHLNGALWGNSFNRGTAMEGSRCTEKRQIRDAIANSQWRSIPGLFDAQARLWPGHAGLTRRRHDEGDLAREALKFNWWQK